MTTKGNCEWACSGGAGGECDLVTNLRAALATARAEERERVASIVEDHGMDADFIRALTDK